MCGACRPLAAVPHWTDGAATPGDFLQASLPLLEGSGLSARRWHQSLVLSNGRGRSETVTGLGELWPAAQRLLGRPLDVLSGVDRRSPGSP